VCTCKRCASIETALPGGAEAARGGGGLGQHVRALHRSPLLLLARYHPGCRAAGAASGENIGSVQCLNGVARESLVHVYERHCSA
jgi:hypothetical protein